jgi:hypothetical protein
MKEYFMEARSISELKRAVAENVDGVLKISNNAVPLTVGLWKVGGVSVDFTLNFDPAGNARKALSLYCLVDMDFTGTASGLNVAFTIIFDTNYPQHLRWDNVAIGQSISGTLKTNIYGRTNGTLLVRSSVPNVSVTMHLDCTVL